MKMPPLSNGQCNMKKLIKAYCGVLAVWLLSSGLLFAQSSGRATYKVYSALAPEGYEAILDFSPERSLYRGGTYKGETRVQVSKKFRKEGNNNYIDINVSTPPDEVCVVMNAGKDELLSYEWLIRGGNLYEYLTHELLREIEWELIDSTKQFGRFTAQGARCAFRGREYDVWYVPEIPVSCGPWKFNGLPGLIVEACERDGGVFRFVLQGVEVKEGHAVPEAVFPKKARRLAIEDYAYFHDNKAADERDLASARAPRGASVTSLSDADGGDESDVERNFKDLMKE